MLTFAAAKVQAGLAMLREMDNMDSVQEASGALSIIVSLYLDEPDPPLDSRYRSTVECLALLEREPELHQLLKQAHVDGSYHLVRNSDFILRPDAIFPPRAQNYLAQVKDLIAAFIAAESPITHWKSELAATDTTIDTHLESLDLPGIGTLPLMILQDLGSFIRDPVLSSRVDNLFVRGKNTVLVNTSGSGKTRLTFEGLCHNWGLYFTVVSRGVQDLGSYDLASVINRLDSDLSLSEISSSPEGLRRLEENHNLAERLISRALLARLLVFRLFLKIAKDRGGITDEHKRRWLLLQLSPSLGSVPDIFHTLAAFLDDFNPGRKIAEMLVDIQELLELGGDFHLFLVLDEGQVTARKFGGAFDPEPGKHPLLLKVVESWEKHFSVGLMSWIVAGTDVPNRIFEAPKYLDLVRWTSDTGSFDDKAVHEQYLRRFLPPAYLDTASGKAFLHRAWTWTRGRHRHTASMLMQILVWYFQQPHTVLDNYIEKTAYFRPTDGKKWIDIERDQDWVKPKDVSSLNFRTHLYSSLQHVNVRHIVRNVVYHHLAANHPVPLFKKDMIGIVSSGFGRFVDGAMENIAFDESIPIVGSTVWMTEQPTRSTSERGKPFDSYLKCIKQYPPASSKAFASCLAFHFSRAFASNPTLSEIFTFADPVPVWAKQSAELVELHGRPGELRYSVASGDNSTGVLATSASSLDDLVSWLEHSNPDRTPFCVPQNPASPDLVFYLKLEDGSYLSILMRVSARSGDDENLLADLEETRLFCDDEHGADSSTRQRAIELLNAPVLSEDVDVSESLTSGSSNMATTRVLRIIAAFEKQIDSDTLMPTEDATPYAHAVLSREMFEHFTAVVSPETFVQTIARNILKRKYDLQAGEGDVDVDDTEEERGAKRRKSMPVESGAEDDTEGPPKSKTAAGSGTKRTRTARSKKTAGATKAASEAVKEHEDVAEAKPKKAARPRGKKAPVSASKKVADAEEAAGVASEVVRDDPDIAEGASKKAGGSRGKKAPASGSKKIADPEETEVDGHEGAAVGKIKSGGARGEQSQKMKAGKAEASHPVDEAETSGRMTLRSQTRREKASSEAATSKE